MTCPLCDDDEFFCDHPAVLEALATDPPLTLTEVAIAVGAGAQRSLDELIEKGLVTAMVAVEATRSEVLRVFGLTEDGARLRDELQAARS